MSSSEYKLMCYCGKMAQMKCDLCSTMTCRICCKYQLVDPLIDDKNKHIVCYPCLCDKKDSRCIIL